MGNMVHERLTMTVEEAAQLMGIGRNTAYDAIRRGEIPAVRIGRRLVVPMKALENLLAVGLRSEVNQILPQTVAAGQRKVER